ncbi:MAG: alginate export family protein [Bacteroidales bacterium]|nr:alginate export family protein [Bacteroidales bacterium]MCF8327545.1 alginate export family protein [Bacteroidales bacterium]
MKRLIYKGVILAMLFFIVGQANAQFTLSGELRPRTELSHGYSELAAQNQDASLFTSQRTRLNLQYSTDKIKTKLVLQDVRLWGSQPQLVANEDYGVSVHEAWAEAFFTDNISLKAGRQEVVYDDHRIFGNVGWAQQGRSHDLFKLKYENKIKAHLGFAYHENDNRKNNLYQGPDAYKTMQYLWINKEWESLQISLLALNMGIPVISITDSLGNILDEDIVYSQTFGFYSEYQVNEKLDIAANAYMQTGKDAMENDLMAYEFAVQAGYDINKEYYTSLRYELLSGNDQQIINNENNSFNPAFGTNHKFNGHMDYFYVGNHAVSVGLQDIAASLKYTKNNFRSKVTGHYFTAAADPGSGEDKYLGTELDLMVGYKLNEMVDISCGYSQMFAGKTMELLKGGNKDEANYWGWLMIGFSPVFID